MKYSSDYIIKNSYGVANIGSFGLDSEGTIGGYEIQGKIKFEFDDGRWTSVYYYNKPSMAIPYSGAYYLHDKLPAYMVKRGGSWLVGSYGQLEKMIKNEH